ncbi:hypothetical protein HU762_00100 [Pseudomonas sp. SWRI92]|uniref:hypothetical protein n=1 Tax=Pseudomonas sp. SWRI92 TaxID=2745499 RepID=UPI001645DA08|nr:hypothetical protein [Pseudomonas sp. SWRI92]MBC3372324.1 hypothetical protein [Pseudomonas sp. SWRI92]
MHKITTYAFALLCMAAGPTYADDPDKEIREQYQRYWEHQREMEKADQENNREHRKAHEEMAREKRKHYEEMEREDARRRAEFYRKREKAYRETSGAAARARSAELSLSHKPYAFKPFQP